MHSVSFRRFSCNYQTVHIMPQCVMILKVYHENKSAVVFHPGSVTQIVPIVRESSCPNLPVIRFPWEQDYCRNQQETNGWCAGNDKTDVPIRIHQEEPGNHRRFWASPSVRPDNFLYYPDVAGASSMIHIVSDAVASATERTNHQHLCCTCRNDRPAPVNHLYTCTHFRTERRGIVPRHNAPGIIRHTVYIFEHTERRHSRFFPERIGVGGCHRNCFIVNNSCVSPAGGCIERVIIPSSCAILLRVRMCSSPSSAVVTFLSITLTPIIA